MERRPESSEPSARERRFSASSAHPRPRRSARGWLWSAIIVIVLLAGVSLLGARPGGRVADASPRGLPPAEAASWLERAQRWVGLGAPSERRRGSPASDPVDPPAIAGAPQAGAHATNGALRAALTGTAGVSPLAPGATLAGPGARLPEGLSAGSFAAEESVPRDARIAGRVLDATGGPIAGARVRAYFEELWFARSQRSGGVTLAPAPDAEWITDAEGRFDALVPAGGVSLVASAEAYAETRKRARAPAADVALLLAPGARVSGRVQRSDGSPVAGASVQIEARAMDRAGIEVTSDAQGEFSLSGVPAGVVEVVASAAGLSPAREWLRLTLAEISAPVVLTLTPAHSVHGVVRAPDGSPCAAGLLQAAGGMQHSANIDAEGRYRLDGLDAGTYELSALCFSGGSQTRSVHVGADSAPSIELDWQLDVGFAVSGSVRQADGEPFAGAMVWLFPVAAPDGARSPPNSDVFMGHIGTPCNADEAGEFRCGGLRAGWYRVQAGSPSGASAGSEPVLVDAESEPRVALVVPAAGEVRVRVVGAATGGVASQFARGVFARGASADTFPIPALLRGDRFVFASLALGRYRVAIGRAPSEPGPSAVDVELREPGQIIEVELHAPEAMAIGGSVVDAAGEPVPDAWVDASLVEAGFPLSFAVADPVLTNLEGRFELGDLPPGRYALRAEHANGEAQNLEVSAGQRDVRLIVQGHGSLTGRVTGADGQPARDFSVLVFREAPGQALSVDGERGAWALPWLQPGEYRIVVMSQNGGASTSARVTTARETTVALRLDPELAGQAILRASAPRR